MFSSDITLNEFVLSIPICQPEADLGSILNIFHQTRCQSVAIPRGDSNWGIISSQSLLSLMAQSWKQSSLSLISYPKNLSCRDAFLPKINDLDRLIEPAIIYSADTKLEEFLSCLQDNPCQDWQNEYLIVSTAGELKGILDKNNLLGHLALRKKKDVSPLRLPVPLTSLWELVNKLTIPIKIETSTGKDVFYNHYWQELVFYSHDNLSPPSQSNVSIATWWMEQQLNTLENDGTRNDTTTNPISFNYGGDFCCLEGRHTPRSSENLQNLEFQSCSPTAIDYPQKTTSIDRFSGKLANDSNLGIQIEQGNGWYHIRLPLKLESGSFYEAETISYWLVLAINSSLVGTSDSEVGGLPQINTEPTFDKLLATISHELKSPLTGIVGLSSLLKAQKLGTLNQRQTLYLQLIYNSGHKLMDIVNNLLELTSLTAEKNQLKSEIIELESLFPELYQQIVLKLEKETTFNKAGIKIPELLVNIEPGTKIAIADSLRLSSILTHLMLEAVNYAESRNASAIEITVNPSQEGVAIKIDKNIQDVYDSSAVIEAKESGSTRQSFGLNLMLAKYLVQALQGNINSIYYPRSCSFTLLLPQVSSQPEHTAYQSAPVITQKKDKPQENLTILCLYPEPEALDSQTSSDSSLDFNLKNWAEQDWSDGEQKTNSRHRIIEADGLLQAHTLARIWQLNAIVLDGYQIANPEKYLRSLQESEYLSVLPLVTLDAKTTEAANQIEGLNVYPCLLPAKCRSFKDLMQVIQIATGTNYK